ncbi:unnamed protein product [Symbiodinium necroappetens]|uniref:Uncharacterized protein n=1 Tax=Symbiodinium necroappetens TaxID=1628268 RepID=A0A812SXE7_9DINO|nr:unnamed protein product [Symbiodinium necroappetens]
MEGLSELLPPVPDSASEWGSDDEQPRPASEVTGFPEAEDNSAAAASQEGFGGKMWMHIRYMVYAMLPGKSPGLTSDGSFWVQWENLDPYDQLVSKVPGESLWGPSSVNGLWCNRQGHLWIRPDTVDTDSCRYCEAPQRGGFLSLGQALTGFGRGTGRILLGDSTEAEIAGKLMFPVVFFMGLWMNSALPKRGSRSWPLAPRA